jgi:hypothetical protein
MTKEFPEERIYIAHKYRVAKGNWDLYIPFFEVGCKLMNGHGILSLITPNKWITAPYAEELRKYLENNIQHITDCSQIKVFEAGNNPLITFIKQNNSINVIHREYFNNDFSIEKNKDLKTSLLNANKWGILLINDVDLIIRLSNIGKKIAEVCTVETPFTVSEAYELVEYMQDIEEIAAESYLKFINTGTIDRYVTLWGKRMTTYIKHKYKYPVVKKSVFNKHFPKRYMQSTSPKIVISGMRYFECFIDALGEYIAGKSTVLIYEQKNISLIVLMSILNSKLITYYLKQLYCSSGIDGGISFTAPMIRDLPIPEISESDGAKISVFANQMIGFQKQYHSTNNEGERQVIKKQIDNIDAQIDCLVYSLYGLTKEESKIVDPDYE